MATHPENPHRNPFPGMNPYLESPRLWPEVHNKIIAAMHRYLRRRLPFRYSVIMEERLGIGIGVNPPDEPPTRYIRPDLTITGTGTGTDIGTAPGGATAPALDSGAVAVLLPVRETVSEWFISIATADDGNGNQPVTILEVLSPSNKRAGAGRNQYLDKRGSIIESAVHLVEIDLVRQGTPMPYQGYDHNDDNALDAPYRHLISRWQTRPWAAMYPFALPSAIPDVTVPLLEGDAEPQIPLNALLHDLYRADYYANYVDYTADPAGPLSDNDRRWLDGLLRAKGLRR